MPDLQIRKITLDAKWNELERGNTGASRLCKSSPNNSRIERLYPKLVEVREMKKGRNIQETFTYRLQSR